MSEAAAADVWSTGPTEDRFRYRVDDPEPLPGGQGFVFCAVTEDGTRVALKLREDAPDDVERRTRERLDTVHIQPHPGLAEPLEIFRGPGLFAGPRAPALEDSDLLYVASRWVPGTSLRASAPLRPDAVGRMARSLADGLTHLHEVCGLVHRDVHPGNVIVGPSTDGTLIDLGAARPEDGASTVTVAGAVGFIAPERTHGPGDRRTDAWGLGMVTAFALVGHSIAGATDDELLRDLARAVEPGGDPRRTFALIRSMTDHDPAARPSDLRVWAAELHEAVISAPRRVRRAQAGIAALAVTAAAAAVVAVGVARAGRYGEDEATTTSATRTTAATSSAVAAGCTEEIGTPDSALTAEHAASVVAATDALAQGAPEACGTGFASLFGEAVYQPVRWSESGEDRDGIVLTSTSGTVLLTGAQWTSYREIAGRQRPENAITFGGYPLAVDDDPLVGGSNIELSNGGLVLGARTDSQSFWMPKPVRDLWEARGGVDGDLGLPMTNPYVVPDGLQQDFAGGYLSLPAEVTVPLASITPDLLVVHVSADPRALLPARELRRSIVRQPIGSAWWLDRHGERHWIPDGGTWECLGGADAVSVDGLAGAALATFPLGEPATCEMAG